MLVVATTPPLALVERRAFWSEVMARAVEVALCRRWWWPLIKVRPPASAVVDRRLTVMRRRGMEFWNVQKGVVVR